ncbi:MAG: hypothetical protein A3G76_03670 [Acidobacteria bacterium RIFCSPLOWO2_12_FULL_65_11]|nr:MAG: hypothetical protein A3H95_07345 [Acidobacteria bacterium RIFCSPLOWO2_02_FULL_64_15]OFW30026.1 MAG: hypothetical protein A3G76_03670 [Acidobacteria bacterium RIFCSPLOWO2_12_FULL_65_11]
MKRRPEKSENADAESFARAMAAENIAILKSRVRECLRRHPAVLAYADAPRGDGGTGAVYVLLRK